MHKMPHELPPLKQLERLETLERLAVLLNVRLQV
jgi:hypothetical protein